MQRQTKRTLGHIATGIAGVILAAFAYKQYYDKNRVIEERDAIIAADSDSLAKLAEIRDSLKISQNDIEKLTKIASKRETEILLLRDALETAEENLSDCQSGYKSRKSESESTSRQSGTKGSSKSTSSKSRSGKRRTSSAKTSQVSSVETATQSSVTETVVDNAKPVVYLAQAGKTSGEDGKIVVSGDKGNNTFNINTGTINNYYNDVADTVKRHQSRIVHVYGDKRVLCH